VNSTPPTLGGLLEVRLVEFTVLGPRHALEDHTRRLPYYAEFLRPSRPECAWERSGGDERHRRGAARCLRQAARRLAHTDGLSLRDAATVLGVPFGRVQQLLKD
jgi:DNA-directed RNA polymerase specialized sigma24 family protein